MRHHSWSSDGQMPPLTLKSLVYSSTSDLLWCLQYTHTWDAVDGRRISKRVQHLLGGMMGEAVVSNKEPAYHISVTDIDYVTTELHFPG